MTRTWQREPLIAYFDFFLGSTEYFEVSTWCLGEIGGICSCLINDHLGNWVSLMKWVHASICEVYGKDWLKEILADCWWKGEAHRKGSVLQGRLSSWPRSWIQKLETHLVGNSVIIIAIFDHLITLPIIFDQIIIVEKQTWCRRERDRQRVGSSRLLPRFGKDCTCKVIMILESN